VRDLSSGQLDLITEPQVFFPSKKQQIEEVRKRIRLEDHQAVIVKDKKGKYIVRKGTDKHRSFFLEPYCELVVLTWSTGILKDRKALKITHLDTRPQFTWFDFEIRTQDNVELMLGVTFFWNIHDVEQMIHITGDACGDMCSHARSIIIQSVSRVTLEKFLSNFNEYVARANSNPNDDFYKQRGLTINELEVRSITCKDPNTQKILQEIIQETTNRLSKLQKQDSENEVLIKRIQGEIAAEKMNEELFEIKQKHLETQSLANGASEGRRVKAFIDALGKDLSPQEKVGVFGTLRKQEVFDGLSKSNAHMYFTPNDISLNIKSVDGLPNQL